MAPLLPRLGITSTSTPLSALKTAPSRWSNSVAEPVPPSLSVSRQSRVVPERGS